MDFQFFSNLTPSDARTYLQNFRTVTQESRPVLIAECSSLGIACDYSIESAIAVTKWATTKMCTRQRLTSNEIPIWIRQTPEFDKLSFAFDETSRILILRVASYIGECYVKTFKSLQWGTGKPGFAFAHQPVIVGFDHGLQLAVLTVCENMIRSSLAFPEKAGDIEKALTLWAERATQ